MQNHQLQGKEDRCKPPLGPLARAAPAPPRASGREDSLQNCSPARVRRRRAKGQERGAPGPSSLPDERSARGLPAGWGLLRPSSTQLLGEGLRRPVRPGPGQRTAGKRGLLPGAPPRR